MNLTVHQSIIIHNLKINAITNSSVLQIGSAGVIKGESKIYNTGGFTEKAPEARKNLPLVPLQVSS